MYKHRRSVCLTRNKVCGKYVWKRQDLIPVQANKLLGCVGGIRSERFQYTASSALTPTLKVDEVWRSGGL
jgi:hypothetical protein